MSSGWDLILGWFLGVLVALLVSTEVGFWAGRRGGRNVEEHARAHLSGVEAALLGLLALLLGFTFSMSVARFDLRKELILNEANALETAYLRAGFLSEANLSAVRETLRSFVDARVEYYSVGADRQRMALAENKTQQAERILWSQVEAANRLGPVNVPFGLFVQSVNEAIDLDAKGTAALENHVPDAVLGLLVLAAVVASISVGVVGGLANRRTAISQLALPLLLALVMAVIVDLDRPRRGLIQVGYQSMQRVQKTLRSR